MADVNFDSYQSRQLHHYIISEENGQQGRAGDFYPFAFDSHFPEYDKHPRVCSEIKTPKAWKPFNCDSSVSGSACRPSQGGKFPFAQEEGVASNRG